MWKQFEETLRAKWKCEPEDIAAIRDDELERLLDELQYGPRERVLLRTSFRARTGPISRFPTSCDCWEGCSGPRPSQFIELHKSTYPTVDAALARLARWMSESVQIEDAQKQRVLRSAATELRKEYGPDVRVATVEVNPAFGDVAKVSTLSLSGFF